MAYSKDLKKRVLDFLNGGGSKTEASHRFNVARGTVYVWLSQPVDHKPGKPGPTKSRKFDQEALRAEVEARPDALLQELADSRKVSVNAIFKALKRMGIVRKKKRFDTQKACVILIKRDTLFGVNMALSKDRMI